MKTDNSPVLIVGAGPTGLVMAAELARRGVGCRVIDKAPHRSQWSKALGIQARTLEVFQNMGIADAFTSLGNPAHAANLHSGGRRIVRLPFDGLDSPYPYLLILPQSETERLLEAHLSRQGVPVERQTELTALVQDEAGVTATLCRADGGTEGVRSDWLIGCDGAHSTVRHALGLPFEGAAYPEQFLLADAPVDWPGSDNELHVFLTLQGVLALFPLGGGRWRLIADDPPEAMPGHEPTRDECQALAHARGPGGIMLGPLEWSSNFRISQRLVARLRTGRVFLAGDAAHIHSPVGGQGMNTGIQDAANLAWKLALVVAGRADPKLLESYHAERHPVAQAVLRGTDLLTQVATAHSPAVQSLQTVIAPALTSLPLVRARLRENISQIAVRYPASPTFAEDTHSVQFRSGPGPGDRAPDGSLAMASGERTSLFDLLRFPGHTLLLLGARGRDDARVFGQITEAVQRDFAGLVAVHQIPPTSPNTALLRRYAAASLCLYLVRPDGYIGYRAAPPDLEKLREYLTRTLTLRPHVDNVH